MTTIFELVNNALATLSPAVVFAMGDLIGSLPDTYIVYTVIDGVPEQHADDEEIARTFRVQLSIMCRSGLVSLPNTDSAMRAAGFTLGPERELPKDSTTSHYGLAKDYFYSKEIQ
jgi:hypothetical protein